MQAIGDYTHLIKLILQESGKCLALLLLAVLAIRLWRRWPKLAGANRQKTLRLAVLMTLTAGATGYLCVSHSLSLLYSTYGMRAFRAGNLGSALLLCHKSEEYWKTADAVGEQGVCLLLLGRATQGARLLDEAKAMRQGQNSAFEQHFEGVFYFLNEEPDKAFPLLKASSGELTYRWDALKILAVMLIERGQISDAADLMKPFLQVEVKDIDQAYVMASLKLSENKQDEAVSVLNRFPTQQLPDFWKARFDKLRARAQGIS